ncbi:MAG TPA: hypothetical protein VGO93_30555 [Candidatus Xenobia bacterium]
MKKMIFGALAAVMLLVPFQAATAQIVPVNKKYTIKQVDTDHNRLEVKYLNAYHEPVKEKLLVDVDGRTRVFMNGRPVAWTALRPGMEIDVKGGLEDNLHVRAKSIDVLRLHV